MPTTPSVTIEALTSIWEKILQRSPIAADENFFDLGGTEPLIDALFAEVARVFGRKLPRAAIGCAPTIATMISLIEQPTLIPFPPFIQMRPGSQRPPVFIVPGLGASAAECFHFARGMQTAHPIYGAQTKGIDGLLEPLDRVEDMAEFYLGALWEIENQGPYLLIGYSFGGLVALEMAQRLTARGKSVALLAMLDTYPDAQSLSRFYRLRLAIQHSFFHLHEMQRLKALGALQYFAHKLKGRLGFSSMPLEAASTREIPGLSFAEVPYRVQQKARIAMEGYRPQFYCGKIRFLAAKTSSFFLPPDPTSVWKNFCRDFELESLSCDHFEMMGSKRDYFASVLTHYVHEAINKDSAANADANAAGKQISANS